jgi:hypothetical protein
LSRTHNSDDIPARNGFSGPEYFHVIFSRQMTAMIPGTSVENPFTAKYAVPADQRFF